MEDLSNLEIQKYIDPYSYGEMTLENRKKYDIVVDENIDALYDEIGAQSNDAPDQEIIINNFFAGMTPLYIRGGEFFVMLDKDKGLEPIVDRAHFQLWCEYTSRIAEISQEVDVSGSTPEKTLPKDFTSKILELFVEKP